MHQAALDDEQDGVVWGRSLEQSHELINHNQACSWLENDTNEDSAIRASQMALPTRRKTVRVVPWDKKCLNDLGLFVS